MTDTRNLVRELSDFLEAGGKREFDEWLGEDGRTLFELDEDGHPEPTQEFLDFLNKVRRTCH